VRDVYGQRQRCVAGLLDSTEDVLGPLLVALDVELKDFRRGGRFPAVSSSVGWVTELTQCMMPNSVAAPCRGQGCLWVEHLQRTNRGEDGGNAQLLAPR